MKKGAKMKKGDLVVSQEHQFMYGLGDAPGVEVLPGDIGLMLNVPVEFDINDKNVFSLLSPIVNIAMNGTIVTMSVNDLAYGFSRVTRKKGTG